MAKPVKLTLNPCKPTELNFNLTYDDKEGGWVCMTINGVDLIEFDNDGSVFIYDDVFDEFNLHIE